MADEEQLRDQYRGALLASACGDALGATVEFMSPQEISSQFGVLRDIQGGGWLHLHPGDITDDTQMALCIGHSITELGRFDPDDIARRFLEWYQSNPPDIGHTTRAALEFLDLGLPWHEAGQRGHEKMRPKDASNGSIMRCAPVALLTRADANRNAECSAMSSRITHANPIAVDATVALNAAIAGLLNDPGADPLKIASETAETAELRDALSQVPNLEARNLPAGGAAVETMQAAFWAITHHDSLEETVVAAVNLGHDADTTGAVAGALAGARWGSEAIPERWLDILIPAPEITAIADELYTLSLSFASES